jgi:hypothetical protein
MKRFKKMGVPAPRQTRSSSGDGSRSLIVDPLLGLGCDLGRRVVVVGGSSLLFQDGMRRSRPLAPAQTRLP